MSPGRSLAQLSQGARWDTQVGGGKPHRESGSLQRCGRPEGALGASLLNKPKCDPRGLWKRAVAVPHSPSQLCLEWFT